MVGYAAMPPEFVPSSPFVAESSKISQPESAPRRGAFSFPNGLIDLRQLVGCYGGSSHSGAHDFDICGEAVVLTPFQDFQGKRPPTRGKNTVIASSIIHASSSYTSSPVACLHGIPIEAQPAFDLLKLRLLKPAMVSSIKLHTDLGEDIGTFSLPCHLGTRQTSKKWINENKNIQTSSFSSSVLHSFGVYPCLVISSRCAYRPRAGPLRRGGPRRRGRGKGPMPCESTECRGVNGPPVIKMEMTNHNLYHGDIQ